MQRQPRRSLGEWLLARENKAHDDDVAQLLRRLDAAGIPPDRWRTIGRLWQEYKDYRRHRLDDEVTLRMRQRLEMLCDLPWRKQGLALPSLATVEARLDASLHGLRQVKEAFLDSLALARRGEQTRRAGASPFPPLVFLGPPGVGKTDVASTMAEAVGCPSVFLSLAGGVDPDHFLGYALTYRGSRPGPCGARQARPERPDSSGARSRSGRTSSPPVPGRSRAGAPG